MKSDLFIKIGLIILLLIAGASLFLIKTEGTKCLADPFGFSLGKLQKQTDKPVVCSCTTGYRTLVISSNSSVDLSSYFPETNKTYANITYKF